MRTIKQVAEYLGVSEKTVRAEIKAARLGSYRVRGVYRVSDEQLGAYLDGVKVEVPKMVTRPGRQPFTFEVLTPRRRGRNS